MSEVEDKVANIIVRILGVERDSIIPAARFQEDLEADSLEVVDMIMSVEDTFNIEIPDEAAETLHAVGDLIAYIRAQQRS